MHLTPKEAENARKEMNKEGDDEVTFEEFLQWLVDAKIWRAGEGVPTEESSLLTEGVPTE